MTNNEDLLMTPWFERWVYGVMWLGLLLLATLPLIPEGTPAATVIANMLRMDFAEVNGITFAVFNLLGVLPAACAAILLYDTGRLPPQPFVIGSFFLGGFALLPYLAWRRTDMPLRAEPDPFTRALGSAAAGLIYVVLAAVLVLLAILWGDPRAYWQQAMQSKFIAVMSLDFLILTAVMHRLVSVDRARRITHETPLLRLMSTVIPLFGPLLYLSRRRS